MATWLTHHHSRHVTAICGQQSQKVPRSDTKYTQNYGVPGPGWKTKIQTTLIESKPVCWHGGVGGDGCGVFGCLFLIVVLFVVVLLCLTRQMKGRKIHSFFEIICSQYWFRI